jgi:hypothetical protein
MRTAIVCDCWKTCNTKGRYYDVGAFGILSFEKAGVIDFGVRNTFVCVWFNTKSLVIEFDVIYREHYSINRKDVQPFSTSSTLKTWFLNQLTKDVPNNLFLGAG